MDWRQFVMDLGPLSADAVEAVFSRHGAQAVTLSDAGDTPVLEPGPGETPLWGATRITGLFAPDADFPALCADLQSSLSLPVLPAHRVENLADRAWEREWLQDFRPMQFGRLWICPGNQPPGNGDAVVVHLDPGLAFGTGTHPTTALCLEWLAGEALRDCRVLDVGCGSGILAIAALKLGASTATAIDIDPQALTSCHRNAEQNGVADRLQVSHSTREHNFDVVLANILAGPLIDLAGETCDKLATGGRLTLSGILSDQADDVERAYAPWIRFHARAARDDWVRLSGERHR